MKMSEKSELLKEFYFHELDRKKSLEGMFALPTGIIAGLFGLVGYYFTKFDFGLKGRWQKFLEFVFLGAAVMAAILLLLAAYWCGRAVIGSEYEHLPGAETILEYWNSLEDWHEKYSPKGSSKLAQEDFDDFLTTALARCCQKNWRSNHYRSGELYRTKRFIVWALFAIAILSISYYINFWITAEITRV